MDRANENYRNDVYRGNFGYQATPEIYLDVHTGYSLANAGSPNTIETPDPVAPPAVGGFVHLAGNLREGHRLLHHQGLLQPRPDAAEFPRSLQQRSRLHRPAPASARRSTPTPTTGRTTSSSRSNWQITAGIQGSSQDAYLYDDIAGSRTLQNSLSNIGGYAESQWQPITGLNVLNSVRYDDYSDYDGALTWRQGVTYKIAPTGTIVHASGSSSYTPPSAEDLYYPGASNPEPEAGERAGLGSRREAAAARRPPHPERDLFPQRHHELHPVHRAEFHPGKRRRGHHGRRRYRRRVEADRPAHARPELHLPDRGGRLDPDAPRAAPAQQPQF